MHRRRKIFLFVAFILILAEVGSRMALSRTEPSANAALLSPGALIHGYYPELIPVQRAQFDRDDEIVDVLLLGASVLADHGGGTIQQTLQRRLGERTGKEVRIHNLAVSAHSSLDGYYKYRRLGDKRFDLVVYYDAINEARANNCPSDIFREDYSHYGWYRAVNRIESHPELSIVTLPYLLHRALDAVRSGSRDGLVPTEVPRPEWVSFGAEIKTGPSFRRNIAGLGEIARERGEPLLLPTFASYLPENYSLQGFMAKSLDYDLHVSPVEIWGAPENVVAAIAEHNQIIREVHEQLRADSGSRLWLVDVAQLMPHGASYYNDICHLTPRGSEAFVNLILDAAVQALQGAGATAGGEPSSAEPTLIRCPPPARPLSRAEVLATADDPAQDGWEVEALAMSLERRLATLGELLAGPAEPDGERAAPLVAEGFECGALLPSALETARTAGGLRVRRWERRTEPISHRGAAGLASALSELRAMLAPGADGAEVHSEFRVIGLEPSAEHFDARVLYSAAGHSPRSGAQQNATWSCRFTRPQAGGEPRMLRIELEAYQDVLLEGRPAILEDCTAAVMGADPTYAEQVLPGIDHWTARISHVLGMTNIGHHGLALGDADGDGLDDLYVCDDGGLPNRLYRQNPDGTVTDISAEAGVDWLDHSSSALFVDLDNDADQDLVVAMRGLLLFAQNNGSCRFSARVRIPMGIGSMSLSAADYDRDGDLDVHCCIYNAHLDSEGIAFPYHAAENGTGNLMLRNAGGFRFVDATAETGLDVKNRRFSFASAWEDYDDDGDLDLYIANDFGRNCLYRNDGGRFAEVASEAGVDAPASGMSAAWGDYDRDGRMDIYVANLYSPPGLRVTMAERFAEGKTQDTVASVQHMALGNSLYANAGGGTFRDVSLEAGVNMGRWAWGAPFIDLDGDGWEDLVVANGYYTMPDPRDLDSFFWRNVVARSPRERPPKREIDEYRMWWLAMTNMVKRGRSYNGNERNCAFLNLGDRTFADVSAVSGFDFPEDGRAVALTDWDCDGDLDLWVRNRSGPRLRLLSNQLDPDPSRSFVAFHLQGTSSNRDAIGARVEVELEQSSEGRLLRTLRAGEGFLAQSSKWVHFGLGPPARVRSVHVRWPSGVSEVFTGVEAGRRYSLVEGSGAAMEWVRPGGPVHLAPAEQIVPALTERAAVFLPARFPCPILRCVPAGEKEPREIETRSGPLLILLAAAWCEESVAQIAELTRRAEDLRAAGLDVLALDVGGLAEPLADGAQVAERAGQAIDFTAFPFRTGRATAELLDKIELVQDYLFDRVPPPCVPMGLLVDQSGRLSAIYRGRPEMETLLLHVDTLDAVIERRYEVAMPIPGRWKVLASDVGELAAANWFLDRYHEDSERYYERAIADGSGAALQATGDGEATPDRARALFRLAEMRIANEREDEALELLRRSIELDPAHADVQLTLGDVLTRRGERAEAMKHYRRAIDLDPRHANAHYGLGNALKQEGRVDEAMEEYRRTLELAPAHAPALNNLGIAHFERGQIDEAIPCFEKAIASEPELAASHYVLGATRALRGERGVAEASYRRALELDPSFVDVHFQRGEGLLADGRIEEAASHFTLVLAARPDFAPAYLRRAQARARAGEQALALEDLRQAENLVTDPGLRAEIAKLFAELQ